MASCEGQRAAQLAGPVSLDRGACGRARECVEGPERKAVFAACVTRPATRPRTCSRAVTRFADIQLQPLGAVKRSRRHSDSIVLAPLGDRDLDGR